MNKKIKQLNAFTLAEGGHSPLLCATKGAQSSSIKSLSLRERVMAVARQGLTATGEGANAFTLAEILITLGVIGVVAAVTMPTLVTNIQERVRKEQVRTVKYKFTKATDKMKSLGKIGPYDAPATKNFVNELKKHMTIAKVCDSENLGECWPTDTINTYQNNSPTLSSVSVSSLKKGTGLKALAISSGNEDTVGIVTGDGVPMLLVYSPKCEALDEVKSYTWSVEDGKPVTNATTNCISAIFDINGAKGPNKIGQDVRTLNSLMGYKLFGATAMTQDECLKQKDKLGINDCCPTCDANGGDYYAGAVKACADIGLHLPSLQTLANLAGAVYGRTDIGVHTLIMRNGYSGYTDCHQYFDEHDYFGRKAISEIICTDGNIPTDANTPIPGGSTGIQSGLFWSSTEVSPQTALIRSISSDYSTWDNGGRKYDGLVPLCVGD